MPMYPNDNHTSKNKNPNHDSKLAETISAAEKSKTKNPPGVTMPPENEMSPAQLG